MREDLRNTDENLVPVDVETALAKLQPRPASLDRERLLFLAGRAAAIAEYAAPKPQRRWLWPTATIVSFAASLVFGVLYGMERSRPQPPRRIVYVDRLIEREPVARHQKPVGELRNLDVPAVVDDSSQNWFAESRLLRSGHPVLMTDADHLPAAPFGGSGLSAPRQSIQQMRRSMLGGYSVAEPSTPSGFQSLFNRLPLGRGGL